jgi:hypothetical protein
MTGKFRIHSPIFFILLWVKLLPWTVRDLTVLFPVVEALYVSYEAINTYKVGDRCVVPLVKRYLRNQRSHGNISSSLLFSCLCSVPILVDKVTSPITFASTDYSNVPLCLSTDSTDAVTRTPPSNRWNAAITALHGNAYHPLDTVSLTFGYDLFCAPACSFPGLSTETEKELQYANYIRNDYYYNVYVDGLPAAYQSETEYVLPYTASLEYCTIPSFF